MNRGARYRRLRAVRGQFIIEGAGKDARRRGLADAAHPGQNISLVDSVEVEGVRQRPDHGLLADQILEARGAVFPGENTIRRRLFPGGFVRRGKSGQSQPGSGFVIGVRRWFHAIGKRSRR